VLLCQFTRYGLVCLLKYILATKHRLLERKRTGRIKFQRNWEPKKKQKVQMKEGTVPEAASEEPESQVATSDCIQTAVRTQQQSEAETRR
jgi:hypothetical protein